MLEAFRKKLFRDSDKSSTDIDMKWAKNWENNEKFLNDRKEKFITISKYLNFRPSNLLEIGCGLALESEMFQKKFGTELNFLEGDIKNNENKKNRDVGFDSANNMQFYLSFEYLKKHWDERKLRYNLIDVNNIIIPNDKKFELIYSLKSCGFHYPLNIYFDLIKKHSDSNTRLIFEIRDSAVEELKNHIDFISEIIKHDKSSVFEIKLK